MIIPNNFIKRLFARGPSANKKLFTGGPLAKQNLFVGGPPANKKLFVGGLPANKKFFAVALSLLCSPEWFYTVLFSLLLYCMVLYSNVWSFKGVYCCITVLSSLVLDCYATSRMVFFRCVWSIRNFNIFSSVITSNNWNSS